MPKTASGGKVSVAEGGCMKQKKRVMAWVLVLMIVFTVYQVRDVSEAATKSVAGAWKKDTKGWYYKFSDGSGYAKDEWIQGSYVNKKGYWEKKWDGEWKKNKKGWWFQAGTWYPKNEWIQYNRKYYYFGADGYMLTDQWIGKYYVDKNGVWTKTRSTTAPDNPVKAWGALQVKGTDLCSSTGAKVQLKGVSTFGIIWDEGRDNINLEAFKTLKSWGVNTIRLAVYTEEYGGYCRNDVDRSRLDGIIENGVSYATQLGLYVIIDWHILNDNNPNTHISEAKQFFTKYSKKYAGYNNILYEICNEPNGGTSWADVKSYADTIIPIIRQNDDDAVILVGTPSWSQKPDEAAKNPVNQKKNVMYVAHFYASEHGSDLRNAITNARKLGAPVFISECSVTRASGDGEINYTAANEWKKFVNDNNLSFVEWSLSNKSETSAMIKSSCSKHSGWTDSDLKDSALFFKKWFGEN